MLTDVITNIKFLDFGDLICRGSLVYVLNFGFTGGNKIQDYKHDRVMTCINSQVIQLKYASPVMVA